MNMVSVEPALLQEDGSANGGEQELPMGTVAGEPGEPGEPVLYKSIDEGEPVLTMEMVSENPPFIDPEGQIVWDPDGPQYLEDGGGDQVYAMNMAPQEEMSSVADGPPPGTMYMTAGVPATPGLTSTTEQLCSVMFGCCEEDCCGAGTSWQKPFCIIDRDSTGFNGTHSSAWAAGCIDRVCCEKQCCSPGTEYDNTTAECVPQGNG
jgi:hypothetical protein